MNLYTHFQDNLEQHIVVLQQMQAILAEPIANAATLIVNRMLEGSKVLACGNGVVGTSAQAFVSMMLNRYQMERPGLPAMSLSADSATIAAIANDYDFDEVYAKQIHALGHPGDLLLALLAGEDAGNIRAAISAAQEREMFIIVISGETNQGLDDTLREQDTNIAIPTESSTVVQSLQPIIVSGLCELIDLQLLGG